MDDERGGETMRAKLVSLLLVTLAAAGLSCTKERDPGVDISAVKAAPTTFEGQLITVSGEVESPGEDVMLLKDPDTPEHTLFVVRTPDVKSDQFAKASSKDSATATGRIAYYVHADLDRELDVNLNRETAVAIEGQPVLMAKSVAGWEQM
jgi:hypothetical protein